MPEPLDPHRLVKTKEAAAILCVSVALLERHRWAGTGPPYYKVSGNNGGRSVRYRVSDLLAWIQANRINPRPRGDR